LGDRDAALEAVHQKPSPSGRDVIYTTDLRIYNDAWLPEGARGFWAYLRDQNDRHFAPTAGAWQDVVVLRVPPHGFARTSMEFVVPEGEQQLGFVTGHGDLRAAFSRASSKSARVAACSTDRT
jgi:hypothetical protein